MASFAWVAFAWWRSWVESLSLLLHPNGHPDGGSESADSSEREWVMDRALTQRDGGFDAPATAGAAGVGGTPTRAHPQRRLALSLPADARALEPMRRRVEAWLAGHRVDEDALIDIQLALGEAVSNGMEHAYRGPDAGSQVEVELEFVGDGAGRELAVLVRDRGRWLQARTRPSTRGRGLAMIEALAADMRVTSNAQGTEVTFSVPCASVES
jgi:anti-sigma regulatory factor (Ser/Thr protein kinase)